MLILNGKRQVWWYKYFGANATEAINFKFNAGSSLLFWFRQSVRLAAAAPTALQSEGEQNAAKTIPGRFVSGSRSSYLITFFFAHTMWWHRNQPSASELLLPLESRFGSFYCDNRGLKSRSTFPPGFSCVAASVVLIAAKRSESETKSTNMNGLCVYQPTHQLY